MRLRALCTSGLLLGSLAFIGVAPVGAAMTPIQIANQSVSPANAAANANSSVALVSNDGAMTAFTSAANNLITGFVKNNGFFVDVWVRDRSSNETLLVSRAAGSSSAGANGASLLRDIDGSGRYVAFASRATDLVSGFSNSGVGTTHLYLFDRETATVVLVDHVAGSATTAGDGDSGQVVIADNGSRVIYQSTSTNLVSGATTTGQQVYEYDVTSGVTRIVSHVAANPLAGAGDTSNITSVSGDGSVVSFTSGADDLVAGFSPSAWNQAYVSINGSVALVSRANGSPTTGANGDTDWVETSLNGAQLAFTTYATDVLAGITDTNAQTDVFRYDVATGSTQLVSRRASSATTTANGYTEATGISANGARILLVANATDLVSGFVDNSGGQSNVYFADLAGGTLSLVSRAPGATNQGADDSSGAHAISADGRVAVFQTMANNLGWNSATFTQLALANLDTGDLTLVSRTSSGNGANAPSLVVSSGTGVDANMLSSTGRYLAFDSAATDLTATVVGDGATPQAFLAEMPIRTGEGYWLIARDGGVFSFGDAQFYGSTGAIRLNQPVVGGTSTPSGDGYWFVAADGGIFSFGDAQFSGSTGGTALNQPIVGMIPVPWSWNSYWLVASDGGIFSFGPNATFHGSTGAIHLNQPVVGGAPTPSGKGYWFVAADGGIFSFGDAAFYGSTGGIRLNEPIVGMAATPSGRGYWLVSRDGGIFSFGDAAFYGSTGGIRLNQPVVGMTATPTGLGYWFTAADGGIFSFGDAAFYGSTGGIVLNQPIVGLTPS